MRKGGSCSGSKSGGAPPGSLDYRSAGVDVQGGNQAVKLIAPLARATFRPEVLGDIGGFGGFCRLPAGYREPVLVAGADGVGTKLKVAFALGRHDTVGIDCVAMNVNDVLAHGAEPLFFLDYLAVGKLDPKQVAEVVAGVAEGCRQAGCALLGGETAEMPGFYAPGEYDLAGFAVGVVERSWLTDGSTVRPGDVVLGLASSGLHSNGFSLVRRILLLDTPGGRDRLSRPAAELGEKTLGEVLLEPTRMYVRPVLSLLAQVPVRAMAHITGGGLVENVPRVIPRGCRVIIRRDSWRIPEIFHLLRREGCVPDEEMWRVFNMGLGFVLVVDADGADLATEILSRAGEQVYRIGSVEPGDGLVLQ
ncbi:MAG: phosphoribosylformylglycinamidine cyclo-ligase [Bacillota bacterium]|nr:phosphoribosylformylglycinamidine cyclo-ligase [Bacillota bacterium]